jgi:beta-galactosidase
VGTVVKEESFYDELITKLLADAGIKTYIDLPIGVEASIRQGDSKKLLFLINHTEESRVVKVPAVVKKDLLSGEKTEKNIELGIFGVAVIEL